MASPRPSSSRSSASWPTDASATVAGVAFATLGTNLAAFLAHEAGAWRGDDPDAVHDMRVASRRIRAAMSLFSDALPDDLAECRGELKWVASDLGAVRDLDVQLEQIRSWTEDMDPEEADSLKSLLALIEDRRRAARARLVETLESDRYARLVASLRAAVALGPEDDGLPAARTPITDFAPPVLERRYRRVRAMGKRLTRSSDPTEFHALRIRAKRLRYGIEFVRGVYPKSSKRMVRRLVALQDLLGEHQDAQVAMGHLRALADDPDLGLSARALLALGRVTERYERHAAELRRGFRPTFDRIPGKPWKRFRREMRRAGG